MVKCYNCGEETVFMTEGEVAVQLEFNNAAIIKVKNGWWCNNCKIWYLSTKELVEGFIQLSYIVDQRKKLEFLKKELEKRDKSNGE